MVSQRNILMAARVAVFAFVAIVCFWKLGAMPLLETDEGFAANRAASMWRHDTWRLSYDDVRDDLPQFHKPPMLYWIVTSLYPLFDRTTLAVRLPGAVAAFALCWILFRINRRHFDEVTALGSVVLLVSVPFVVVHIRTAMLEMPLIFLTFATVYALAYLPPPRVMDGESDPHRGELITAILAGLAGGAAVLMKGMPGFLAIAVAAIHALILNRCSPATFRRIAIAVFITSAMFAIYAFWIVPHAWRAEMLDAMFLKEGTHRTTSLTFAKRFGSVSGPLWDTARYLLLLAPVGLVFLFVRGKKEQSEDDDTPHASPLLWIPLLLLVCVPVIWVGAKQVVPYPRYFLPVFPFLATLVALGVSRIARGHIAALLVVIVIGALTYSAPLARAHNPGPKEMPMPGMREIASLVPVHVMEDEHIILAADKIKCHQLLFYGNRAIMSQARWLADDFRLGAVRYAIAKPGYWINTPLVRVEKLDEMGDFEFLRISVISTRRDIAGVRLCKEKERDAVAAELTKKGIRYEPFESGFLLLMEDKPIGIWPKTVPKNLVP